MNPKRELEIYNPIQLRSIMNKPRSKKDSILGEAITFYDDLHGNGSNGIGVLIGL